MLIEEWFRGFEKELRERKANYTTIIAKKLTTVEFQKRYQSRSFTTEVTSGPESFSALPSPTETMRFQKT